MESIALELNIAVSFDTATRKEVFVTAVIPESTVRKIVQDKIDHMTYVEREEFVKTRCTVG